ncbi:MAG: dihydrodipicolinate synthase family protein [Alphaproteobacteria bacterium]
MSNIMGVNAVASIPFCEDGSVDYIGFETMLEHLKQSGCHGITLFGIASEFYKLTDTEKDKLARLFILSLSKKNIYSCLSVTQHSTEVAVKQAQNYESLGANALMVLPPFFLNPTIGQILEHIFSILDNVSIPTLIQYAPTETGLVISEEDMAKISEQYPHSVFKIECQDPVKYSQKLLEYAPNAIILNGYAGLYMIDILSIGGKAVMPGCSFVEIYVEIYRLYFEDKEKAKQLHQHLFSYIQKWMSHPEYIIQIEKEILKQRGIINSSYCRRPACLLQESDFSDIKLFLQEFKGFLT